MTNVELFGKFYFRTHKAYPADGIIRIEDGNNLTISLIRDQEQESKLCLEKIEAIPQEMETIRGYSLYNISRNCVQMHYYVLEGCVSLGNIGYGGMVQASYEHLKASTVYRCAKQPEVEDMQFTGVSFDVLNTDIYLYTEQTRNSFPSCKPWEQSHYVQKLGEVRVSQEEISKAKFHIIFDRRRDAEYIGNIINDIQNLLAIATYKFHPVRNIKPQSATSVVKEIFLADRNPQEINIPVLLIPEDRPEGLAMREVFQFDEINRLAGLAKWLEYMHQQREKGASSDIMLEKLLEGHLWSPKKSIHACGNTITALLMLDRKQDIQQCISNIIVSVKESIPLLIDNNWAKNVKYIRNKVTEHPEELKGFIPPSENTLYSIRSQVYNLAVSYICNKVLNLNSSILLEHLWVDTYEIQQTLSETDLWISQHKEHRESRVSMGDAFT